MALRTLSRAGIVALALGMLLPSVALATSQIVTIQNLAFSPASTTVNVGDTVTWSNRDLLTHTATADGGAFNLTIAPGDIKSFVFTAAGTYAYHCSIHPTMTGTVTVLGPTPTPAPPTAPPATTAPVTPAVPIITPPPSPSASASASAASTQTATPSPSSSPSATGQSQSPSASPGGATDLGTGPGPALALGAVVLAAGLAGLAIYLYRHR
jgi:plastocyanin